MHLRIPVGITATIVLFVVTSAVSATLAWARMTAHSQERQTHLDPVEVTKGGGLAYHNEVTQLRYDSEKRLRRTLKSMTFACRPAAGGMNCSVDVPEE